MKISNPLRRTACLLTALSACAAAPALAKDPGFYLGADIGQTTYDLDADSIGLFTIVRAENMDDKDVGFSVTFGYQFMPYLGLELSLSDYGDMDAYEEGFGMPAIPELGLPGAPTTSGGFAEIEFGTRGASLLAVGTLPIQKFELFAKVGAMRAETTVRSRVVSLFGPLPATRTGVGTQTAKTTTVTYSAGAGYTIGEDFFLKLEYMMVPKVGEEGDGDDDLGIDLDADMISLGFQFRF